MIVIVLLSEGIKNPTPAAEGGRKIRRQQAKLWEPSLAPIAIKNANPPITKPSRPSPMP